MSSSTQRHALPVTSSAFNLFFKNSLSEVSPNSLDFSRSANSLDFSRSEQISSILKIISQLLKTKAFFIYPNSLQAWCYVLYINKNKNIADSWSSDSNTFFSSTCTWFVFPGLEFVVFVSSSVEGTVGNNF